MVNLHQKALYLNLCNLPCVSTKWTSYIPSFEFWVLVFFVFKYFLNGLNNLQWKSLELEGAFIGFIDMHSMWLLLNFSAWSYTILNLHSKFSQMGIRILLVTFLFLLFLSFFSIYILILFDSVSLKSHWLCHNFNLEKID